MITNMIAYVFASEVKQTQLAKNSVEVMDS